MIVHIHGTLIEASPLAATIEVQGIGYEVLIPVTTAERLPQSGQSVKLHTHAVYREDSQALYGFTERAERDFFRLLTEKVSGIGPKIALSIMSKLSLPMLQSAIAQGDIATLSKCPGIGRKTAERLVVELRDKVGLPVSKDSVPAGASIVNGESAGAQSPQGEAVLAMIALGYKADLADRAVRKAAQSLGADASTEALIRAALR